MHEAIDRRVQLLRSKHVNKRKKQVLQIKKHINYLHDFQRQFVLVPADKAANNVINPRCACAQQGYCSCRVCMCVYVCMYVCVSTHNCRLTHWNHTTGIPTGSQQYSNRFKFCRLP